MSKETALKSVIKVSLKFTIPVKGKALDDLSAANDALKAGIASLAKSVGIDPEEIEQVATATRIRGE